MKGFTPCEACGSSFEIDETQLSYNQKFGFPNLCKGCDKTVKNDKTALEKNVDSFDRKLKQFLKYIGDTMTNLLFERDKVDDVIVDKYGKLEKIIKWWSEGKCCMCGGKLLQKGYPITKAGYYCESCNLQIERDEEDTIYLMHIYNIIYGKTKHEIYS